MSSILQEDQVFNNEEVFCRVFSLESKKELESRFLKHRISYYVDWQDGSLLQKLLSIGKERIICTIRINKADMERARELTRDIRGIRLREDEIHRKKRRPAEEE